MKIDKNSRKKMESSIIAVHKYLSERVKKMSKHELSNMYAIDAEYFQKVHHQN